MGRKPAEKQEPLCIARPFTVRVNGVLKDTLLNEMKKTGESAQQIFVQALRDRYKSENKY